MADKKSTPEQEQKDIPNGEEVVGTGNEARLKMLQDINDRNDEALAAGGDLKDVQDDGSTSDFDAIKTKSDEQVLADELARAEEEANLRADAADTKPEKVETKHKIKVNGKELELTTEELIARAQKVEAADEYLQDAKNKLREAESKQVSTQAKPEPSHEDAKAKELEERRALVRAIQMGSEEEAMAAIEQLRASVPSVNSDDIARTVDERITFNDAVAKFQTEFKDLVDDPRLLNIVLTRDKELLATGDKRPYLERYRAIGAEVREWRDGIIKSAKPAESEKPVQDKQQRKAAAPSVPQAASAKAPAATDEDEREESPQEIIARMAEKRGGPQWLRG